MFGFLGDNVDSVKQAAEVRQLQAKTVDVSCSSAVDFPDPSHAVLQVNNTGKSEPEQG